MWLGGRTKDILGITRWENGPMSISPCLGPGPTLQQSFYSPARKTQRLLHVVEPPLAYCDRYKCFARWLLQRLDDCRVGPGIREKSTEVGFGRQGQAGWPPPDRCHFLQLEQRRPAPGPPKFLPGNASPDRLGRPVRWPLTVQSWTEPTKRAHFPGRAPPAFRGLASRAAGANGALTKGFQEESRAGWTWHSPMRTSIHAR